MEYVMNPAENNSKKLKKNNNKSVSKLQVIHNTLYINDTL